MKKQNHRARYRGKVSRFTLMPYVQRNIPAIQLTNVKCLDTGEELDCDAFLAKNNVLAGVFIGDTVDFDAEAEFRNQPNRYTQACKFKRPTKIKIYPLGGVK